MISGIYSTSKYAKFISDSYGQKSYFFYNISDIKGGEALFAAKLEKKKVNAWDAQLDSKNDGGTAGFDEELIIEEEPPGTNSSFSSYISSPFPLYY